MIRASTNAQTGNCVFHTSIEMTPKTNMDTIPDATHQLPYSDAETNEADVRKMMPYHHSGTCL